jgi:hypothetical protein
VGRAGGNQGNGEEEVTNLNHEGHEEKPSRRTQRLPNAQLFPTFSGFSSGEADLVLRDHPLFRFLSAGKRSCTLVKIFFVLFVPSFVLFVVHVLA